MCAYVCENGKMVFQSFSATCSLSLWLVLFDAIWWRKNDKQRISAFFMWQYREHSIVCVCERAKREKGNLCNFQIVVVGFRQSKTEQGHFCTFHFYFCTFFFLLHIIYIYSESSFRVYLWPRASTFASAQIYFYIKIVLYIFSVVCWLFVNTPVFPHLSLSSRAGNYPEKYYT